MKSIEELIGDSLKEISLLVETGKSNSRIVLPFYRAKEDNDNTIRYSEQELKQIFLNKIEKDGLYYYSVETPSEYVYSIKNSDKPEIKKLKTKDDHYESARIDVTLYDSNRNMRQFLSHIEFKHGNPDEKEISKDFLRLTHEIGKNEKNFFVHYIVRESDRWMSETYPSIIKKYLKAMDIASIDKSNYRKVYVFLMFIKKAQNKSCCKILKFSLQELMERKNFCQQKFNEETIKQWGWLL